MSVVEVWVADLDVPFEGLVGLLDEAERERAERFVFEHLRRRFVVAHALVRRVLGDVDVAVGEHGKPMVAGGGGPHFNLSHSGERAVLAVRDDGPVGVDVEQVRSLARLDAMAERVMSPSEHEEFFRSVDRTRFFFDVWVAKEAVLKATGEGITRPLREVDTGSVRVVPIEVGAGYVGAVASSGDDWEVSLRRWE